jgi:hypothetical protein
MSSSLTSSFIVLGSRYIKPSILLRSASTDSRKKSSTRIAAFSSLL